MSSQPLALSALLAALLIGAALVAWADLVMDGWVRELGQPSIPLLPDFLRLAPTVNDGAAFGLLRGAGPILLVISAVGLGTLVVYVRRHVTSLVVVPVALLFGGGAANLVERARFGVVLDYFDLGLGSTRWPTFNLSDVAISLGILVLALIALTGRLQPGGPTAAPVGDRTNPRPPRP